MDQMTDTDREEMEATSGYLRYRRSAFRKQSGYPYIIMKLFPGPREKYLLTQAIENAAPKARYVVDAYIPYDGAYTRILCALVRADGVWLFELDGREGILEPESDGRIWRHQIPSGREYRICSPVISNMGHRKALATLFGLDEELVHGVVVFTDDTDFSRLPESDVSIVHLSEVGDLLRSEFTGDGQLTSLKQDDIYGDLLKYGDRDDDFRALHGDRFISQVWDAVEEESDAEKE